VEHSRLSSQALVSGDTLIRSHKDTDEDQAKKDAEECQTHDLIAAAYGEGEAALFLDDSGYVFYSMPLPMNTISELDRQSHEAAH
jgi:hypothetical protein